MAEAQRRNQQLEGEKFEEDVDVGSTKDLINCLLESYRHENLGERIPDETKKYYDLNANELFLIAGCTRENKGQLLNIVMKLEENEYFSFENITMEWNINFVVKEDDVLSSHKDNQCLNYFSCDTGMEELVVAENKEEMYQPEDRLDMEIEEMRKLMINMSKKIHT